MDQNNSLKENIKNSLHKILNSHGYAFHYAVANMIAELHRKKESKWKLEAVEFPVAAANFTTRVDIILRHKEEPFFLLAECKRANPAFCHWCFIRLPDFPGITKRQVLVERVFFHGDKPYFTAGELGLSDYVYHLGIELRSDKKGDTDGKGRGLIEEAATQVCKGLSGMGEEFRRHNGIAGQKEVAFLPVIFTTARIWVSDDADLTGSNLDTGEISLQSANVTEMDWVWFQYQVSPGLKHSLQSNYIANELEGLMISDYIRTIAIVSPSGIEEFLTTEWW